MSKIITLTPEMIEQMQAESSGLLTRSKFTNLFDKKHDDKAVLRFTLEAWSKMTALLRECSKEVAWHGVSTRVEGEENTYLVSDIMVYPQTVGPATVDMDEIAYTKWIIDHDGDERFNHIRFQGHSHVNMQTSPSTTDLNHQDEILSQLGPDDFYIFVIYNKSLSRDIRIYDMATNLMFDTNDVTVQIDWGFDMAGFMEESRSMVTEKTYGGYTGSYTGASGGSSYQGGGNSRPVTPGGTYSHGTTAFPETGTKKPVSKPGDSGWNTDGIDDDESPYPAKK